MISPRHDDRKREKRNNDVLNRCIYVRSDGVGISSGAKRGKNGTRFK